jgi:hypothetical protein
VSRSACRSCYSKNLVRTLSSSSMRNTRTRSSISWRRQLLPRSPAQVRVDQAGEPPDPGHRDNCSATGIQTLLAFGGSRKVLPRARLRTIRRDGALPAAVRLAQDLALPSALPPVRPPLGHQWSLRGGAAQRAALRSRGRRIWRDRARRCIVRPWPRPARPVLKTPASVTRLGTGRLVGHVGPKPSRQARQAGPLKLACADRAIQ